MGVNAREWRASGDTQPSVVALPAGAAAGSRRRAWPGAGVQRREIPRCRDCCNAVQDKALSEHERHSLLSGTNVLGGHPLLPMPQARMHFAVLGGRPLTHRARLAAPCAASACRRTHCAHARQDQSSCLAPQGSGDQTQHKTAIPTGSSSAAELTSTTGCRRCCR